MNRGVLKKIGMFLALLLSSLLLMQFVWQVSDSGKTGDPASAQKINLALRRTANELLLEAGDSTSRIPPVEQTAPNVWLVRLEHSFDYDRLPHLLQESFDLHGIAGDYDVAVLDCFEGMIQLGYNFLDFSRNNEAPCGGRSMETGCYNLQVTFPGEGKPQNQLPLTGWAFSAMLAIALYSIHWKRRRAPVETQEEMNWLHFGESRLDAANQMLVCGKTTHQLTYREVKLLKLFVQHPNQVLERSFILANVWADEGILVGRSVDMFVSRLRKVLRDDPTVQLVAVHGVGYRMEVAS